MSPRRAGFVETPDPVRTRPPYIADLHELTTLVIRLDEVGVDVGDRVRRADEISTALAAAVNAPPDHLAGGLLDGTPEQAVERLRAAAVERAVTEARVSKYHDATRQLARDLAAALRAQVDTISDQLAGPFETALAVARQAAAAGVTPTTDDADVIGADDPTLTAAYRSLPEAVSRLDVLALLIDDLDKLAGVVVRTDLPAGNGGRVLVPRSDGGHQWAIDNRTGRRWLAWVIELDKPEPEPEPDDDGPIAA